MMRHGSVMRPTMYLASTDIKTAFDVARPKHRATIMDDHDAHGWITPALLCEMAGMEGPATFESVESTFVFCEMHPPRKRRSPPALVENGQADPGKCRTRMDKEKDGRTHG